jgi:hypothetical protein
MPMHMRTSRTLNGAYLLAALAAAALASPLRAQAPVFPPIPISPENAPDPTVDWVTPFVQYQYTYDNNLFRLPSSPKDYLPGVTALPPGISLADHLNTASAGVDGHWVISQQSVDYGLEVDENRFVRNTDLNNTSGTGKAVWNWSFASDLTGQLGANYSRSLAGFSDSFYFQRDIIDRQEYFFNGRYQIGPRWAVYGTLDDSYIKNQGTNQEFNDLDLESGKVGVEMATSQANTIGAEYRFTHGHYPHQDATLNGVPFDPDYNENSGVVLVKYAPTEKTTLNADAGYLQRNYPDNPGVGAFSGDIWHLKFLWQATEKTSLSVTGSRDLQAYLYAQSDYFVQQGVAASPVWVQSDKITWVAVVAWYKQDYIEASFSNIVVGPRRDTLSSEQGGIQYTPIRALVLTFDYRHELRHSNQAAFGYTDNLASAGAKFKF